MVGYETSYMVQYLANHGPLAVAVDATTWGNYQGGIIQFHCGTNPNNHAVSIVGYDMTGEKDILEFNTNDHGRAHS